MWDIVKCCGWIFWGSSWSSRRNIALAFNDQIEIWALHIFDVGQSGLLTRKKTQTLQLSCVY